MTKTQQRQFLIMHEALRRIAKEYQTPDQLRKSCEKQYGLSYNESITMAYENLQAEAKQAIKGVRVKNLVPNPPKQ